jgi:spore maturation protein CgeB
MTGILPRRVLIVWYSPQPPLAESLAHAFARQGAATRVFHSWPCNTIFDRYVIHPINHFAHNLRLVPKSVDLFQGHPKSHKEWRSRQLLLLARDFKPDLVVIAGVHRFKPEVLQQLQQSTTVFFWFTESEKRFPEIAWELPFYHQIYMISSASLELAQKEGFGNVSLLQHAVDPSLFRPLDVPQTLDWCFVGQWHPRRQQYVEGLAKVSKNFVIYGTRWRKHNYFKPAVFLRVRGTGIWGEDVVRLYNQTRVVINISVWGDEAQGGKGVNMRLLEVPACRACLLTDFSRDADKLLRAGEDFVSAAKLEEMQEKLAGLLAHPEERLRLAQAGYEKARKVRNYDDLVKQLLADWAARPGR